MSDSNFWRRLAEKFCALPKEYAATIHAEKEAILGQEENTPWKLGGKVGPTAEFEALARRGASRFSRTPVSDLLNSWIEAIHHNVRDKSDLNFAGARIDHVTNEQVSTVSFTMYRLPSRSATYCYMMESDAIQAEHNETPEDRVAAISEEIVSPTIPTIAAQIQKLRMECNWTIEVLAGKTGFDEKTVKRHVSGSAMPRLGNLAIYQQAFSKALNRQILIEKTPPKRPRNVR